MKKLRSHSPASSVAFLALCSPEAISLRSKIATLERRLAAHCARHHLDPAKVNAAWRATQAALPSDQCTGKKP
jgi:hypothetical protein